MYKEKQVDLFEVESNIDIFITRPMGREELVKDWRNIRNTIAAEQQKRDDEFERWNHYLFYLVDEEAFNDLSLKFRIEHDTISSRKILISTSDYDECDFEPVIRKYIKYSFDEQERQQLGRFVKSEEVVDIIKDR